MALINEKKQTMRFVYEPDLDQVSSLMLSNWDRPCWQYSTEMLSSYIYRPCGDPSMSMGLYCGDQLVGYIAYFPYMLYCNSKVHPVVFGTWWTVDRQFASKGIAMRLQEQMLQIARSKGYAGLITFTYADSKADRANRLAFKWLGESFEYKSNFTRMIAATSMLRRRMNYAADPAVCLYVPALKDQAIKCFYKARKTVDMAVVIQGEDADYIFKDRPDTRTWLYRQDDKVCGVINVVKKTILGERTVDSAYIEHIATEGMDPSQQKKFMATVLADPFFDKIDGVCVPSMGQIDEEVFKSMGFYKTSQKFNLFFVPFDESLKQLEVSSFALNFF